MKGTLDMLSVLEMWNLVGENKFSLFGVGFMFSMSKGIRMSLTGAKTHCLNGSEN